MVIIIGLVILVAAVVAGVAGVLSDSGSGHALIQRQADGRPRHRQPRLRAEGRADQATGNIKQAGAKTKDASGH